MHVAFISWIFGQHFIGFRNNSWNSTKLLWQKRSTSFCIQTTQKMINFAFKATYLLRSVGNNFSIPSSFRCSDPRIQIPTEKTTFSEPIFISIQNSMNWDFLHVFHWTYVLHAENVGEFLHNLQVGARVRLCARTFSESLLLYCCCGHSRFYHNIMIFE